MKVLRGMLRVKGKSYREGEDLPEGALTKERIEKLSAAGILGKESKAGPKDKGGKGGKKSDASEDEAEKEE